MGPPPQTVEVNHDSSVGEARRAARTMAADLGFRPEACEEIAIAVTELATNLIKHAGGGTITLAPLSEGGRVGLEIVVSDQGPGIPDVEQALREGYTTGGGLGLGLPGAKRLMDEMIVQSEVGKGTIVRIRKWRRG